MKRVAENGEAYLLRAESFEEFPEIAVKYRVSASDVEVWCTSESLAEVQAVSEDLPEIFAGHGLRNVSVFAGIDVAVFAALVAFVGDVPLKREIAHG